MGYMETINEISHMIDEMLQKIPRQRDYNGVFDTINLSQNSPIHHD